MPLSEIDYVALGDWHGMVQAGEKAWYSGSLGLAAQRHEGIAATIRTARTIA